MTRFLVAVVFALALTVRPAGADHVSVSATVSARVAERVGNSVRVLVEFSIVCTGAERGANYFGNMNLDKAQTGRRIYMGGVSGRAGEATAVVGLLPAQVQTFIPILRISCGEDRPPFHGSGNIDVAGNSVTVPALDAPVTTAPRTSGSSPSGTTTTTTTSTTTTLAPGATTTTSTGGGSGGGDAPTTVPEGQGTGGPPPGLPKGACAVERRGTDGPDVLIGTAKHERLIGLAGNDRLLGRAGHDCLYGGTGNDRLEGGSGDDALFGGDGNDVLIGGSGTNQYDAGAGDDVIISANGRKETVRCGAGTDTVRADRTDRLIDCEIVRRS